MDRCRRRRLFLPLAILAYRLQLITCDEVIAPRAAEKLTMDLSQKKTARCALQHSTECVLCKAQCSLGEVYIPGVHLFFLP